MDKPRPRHTALKSPIIERPDLQSTRQAVAYASLTAAFWALWLYLWLPLLALLAWSLGIEQAYKYMVVLGGYRDVVRLLAVYGLVILLLGGLLITWAVYNILRFRGVENRSANLEITPAEIARDFGMDQISVEKWQREKFLNVTHDNDARILSVAVGRAVAPAANGVPSDVAHPSRALSLQS